MYKYPNAIILSDKKLTHIENLKITPYFINIKTTNKSPKFKMLAKTNRLLTYSST